MIKVTLLLPELSKTDEKSLQMKELSGDLNYIAEQIKLDPDINITFYVKLNDTEDPIRTTEEDEKKIGAANKGNALAIALVYEALFHYLAINFFCLPEPPSH